MATDAQIIFTKNINSCCQERDEEGPGDERVSARSSPSSSHELEFPSHELDFLSQELDFPSHELDWQRPAFNDDDQDDEKQD